MFQDYDANLAWRLCEIMQNLNDNCYVGIDYRYFESTRNLSKVEKIFIRDHGQIIRNVLLNYCNRKRLYIAAPFTCLHTVFEFSSQEYADCTSKIKELFRGRDLVIFSGRTVFDKIEHNVFEYAASRQHVFADSKNAWSQYTEIMAFARQFPKNFTLCFILGPTAKVLAYNLAQEGYTAWDIGHIAKEYDAFMRWNQNPTFRLDSSFFAPD